MKIIITFILSALMLTLPCGEAHAQKSKNDNDYNLQRAWEALEDEKDEAKALDLVNRQLRETPDNVQALLLRVRLNRKNREYGKAMSDINHALKVNKPKKSEVAMSTLYWWKGHLYQDMDETEKSSEALGKAMALAQKDNKENLQGISFDYGCSLAELERYDEADAVFDAMLKEDETDAAAMVGKASTLISRGRDREAVTVLEKAQKYAENYSEVYRFRMMAYKNIGEYNKAIDAGLDWFDKNDSYDTDSLLVVLAKRPNYSEAAIKARGKKSENPLGWDMLLTEFYEETLRYADAIKCCDRMEATYGHYAQFNVRRSDSYRMLGLYDQAIADISKAMEKETDLYTLCSRGDYYRLSGRLDEAIADFTAAIEEAPQEAFPYYRRGWCYEMKGDRKKAMEDYDLGIELDDDYPYPYLMRGELRLLEGDEAGAKEDFEQVIQRDTVINDESCRHYALHFLGKDGEAEKWMDRIIQSHPELAGNYYDQACLYARMGRPDKSVASLRTAFEKGYRSFTHIELDDDMDPVRDLPEFKALVAEFKAKHEAFLKDNDIVAPKAEEIVTEVAMVRKPGGTFEIPCDINGLPLQMIFDTGASDVTISSVEANFMLKNGYLLEKDVKGKRYYQVANGDISEGTVITLREVKVGDVILHNVDASVVKSQKAPLLLGQSAMERFGTITIDNINNKLLIKH